MHRARRERSSMPRVGGEHSCSGFTWRAGRAVRMGWAVQTAHLGREGSALSPPYYGTPLAPGLGFCVYKTGGGIREGLLPDPDRGFGGYCWETGRDHSAGPTWLSSEAGLSGSESLPPVLLPRDKGLLWEGEPASEGGGLSVSTISGFMPSMGTLESPPLPQAGTRSSRGSTGRKEQGWGLRPEPIPPKST